MKHDYRGETAKAIQGARSTPKQTPNHGQIVNQRTSGKESENQGIQGSHLPPPKK